MRGASLRETSVGARAAGASGRARSCVATSSKARELSLPKSFPVFPYRRRSQPPESVSTRPVRPTTGSRFGALPVGFTSWVAYRVGRNQRDRTGGGDDPTPRAHRLGRRPAFPSALRITPNCVLSSEDGEMLSSDTAERTQPRSWPANATRQVCEGGAGRCRTPLITLDDQRC